MKKVIFLIIALIVSVGSSAQTIQELNNEIQFHGYLLIMAGFAIVCLAVACLYLLIKLSDR